MTAIKRHPDVTTSFASDSWLIHSLIALSEWGMVIVKRLLATVNLLLGNNIIMAFEFSVGFKFQKNQNSKLILLPHLSPQLLMPNFFCLSSFLPSRCPSWLFCLCGKNYSRMYVKLTTMIHSHLLYITNQVAFLNFTYIKYYIFVCWNIICSTLKIRE